MMIMGDYFRVGFMMNAVDQHLPPERKRCCRRSVDDKAVQRRSGLCEWAGLDAQMAS